MTMTRYGAQYGPDVTFLGVDRCDLDDASTYADRRRRRRRCAVRRRHLPPPRRSVRAAGDPDHRLPAARRLAALAWRCGPTACATFGWSTPATSRCTPATSRSPLPALEAAVEKVARAGAIPVVLGGDHSIAYPDAKGVANVLGHGRVSMIHFDAHADTGDVEFGSLWGHGQPMRRLHRVRARCAATGSSRSGCAGTGRRRRRSTGWPVEGMRSYEMTEIGRRGLDDVPHRGVRGSPPTTATGSSSRSTSTSATPGTRPDTGTPEPGGLTRAAAARRGAPHLPRAAGRRDRRRRGQPAVRPRRHHRRPREPRCAGGALGDRPASSGRNRRRRIRPGPSPPAAVRAGRS